MNIELQIGVIEIDVMSDGTSLEVLQNRITDALQAKIGPHLARHQPDGAGTSGSFAQGPMTRASNEIAVRILGGSQR